MCGVDPREYRPGTDPELLGQLEQVCMRAAAYARHDTETIRVQAGGTIAAYRWIAGLTPQPPWTGRKVLMPTLADIGVEYEAVILARVQAENRIEFANDTGVLDLLRYLVNPYGGTPWWASIPDPLPVAPAT